MKTPNERDKDIVRRLVEKMKSERSDEKTVPKSDKNVPNNIMYADERKNIEKEREKKLNIQEIKSAMRSEMKKVDTGSIKSVARYISLNEIYTFVEHPKFMTALSEVTDDSAEVDIQHARFTKEEFQDAFDMLDNASIFEILSELLNTGDGILPESALEDYRQLSRRHLDHLEFQVSVSENFQRLFDSIPASERTTTNVDGFRDKLLKAIEAVDDQSIPEGNVPLTPEELMENARRNGITLTPHVLEFIKAQAGESNPKYEDVIRFTRDLLEYGPDKADLSPTERQMGESLGTLPEKPTLPTAFRGSEGTRTDAGSLENPFNPQGEAAEKNDKDDDIDWMKEAFGG